MMQGPISYRIREIAIIDIHHIANYWASATPEYLRGLGADPDKMPSKDSFTKMLESQIEADYKSKRAYALIWEINGQPVGHSNINGIVFGAHAHMHLHLWNPSKRLKGHGATLVKESIPFYFQNFDLNKLVCEPYAMNPAPNRTLKKIGFKFIKTYKTKPGSINFLQDVNQWVMDKNSYFPTS